MNRWERILREREPGERWPRLCVEVPPEIAVELERIYKDSLGVNRSSATKAGILRAALLVYLEKERPEGPKSVEGEAIEVEEIG